MAVQAHGYAQDALAHCPHAHRSPELCEHCGSGLEIEQSYDVKDRFARGLLAAVCRSMGLEPFSRSKGLMAPIYVRAKDRDPGSDVVAFHLVGA